ncbi:MAG: NYN domain-containing protein [Oscillospiraceae bacterium]|nr:NYN domain-containing protein [Oscillospiraceae bacterium]
MNDKKFAVLIDSDNISHRYIKVIVDEVANEGISTYKRIYGDWTNPKLASWKDVLLSNSIMPIQQYSYTMGKNATDSAMIIDAMDILYSGNVEGFFLVSSDSDFTRLASRLRESGMYVVGMGERKTPAAFISACNKFKYLENLAEDDKKEPKAKNGRAKAEPVEQEASPRANRLEIMRAIRTIIQEKSDENGWVFVGEIGNILSKRYPDFDSRSYGFQKLTQLVTSFQGFDVQSRPTSDPNTKLFYAKLKE